MRIKDIFICICFAFFSITIFGQTEVVEKEAKPVLEIFKKEETNYIENWMRDLITDETMTPETTTRFTIITSYYGLKMKQLGEDTKLSKIEIIDGFNNLVKEQNRELEQILPIEQFESFSNFYDKLSWSVNKRLNQL
ncbi:hypothetical protein [Aquimarina mytili]|uniref:Uncharacterized protein n=1 Tax=Aquimarina mytili TaxID=874423 RepID=A0A936ZPI0_9FLAO|nr:hypothetical protein [Aquimarina mytili]MBL0682338.1 hypothetical protein [Aquimarina mytili]